MPNPVLSITPVDSAFLRGLYEEVRMAKRKVIGGLERQVKNALEVIEVTVEDPTPEIARKNVIIYGRMYRVYILDKPELIDIAG